MITETYTLIRTIKKLYPVQQFFKNRYFPDGKVYYSEKVLLEMKKQGRKIAPFVVPIVGGITMESEGYRAEEMDAPYIIPKMPITAKELEKKAFGENPNSGRTPEQRENEIEAEHLDDLRKAIYIRHEAMCTEIITTGQLLMKHYANAEDAANDKNADLKELRYFDDTFDNKYKLPKPFSEMTTSEKIKLLYQMSTILKKRGFRATDLVMTADVSMELMTDEKFLDFYDKARVNMGDIDQKEMPDGVVNNGTINVNGVLLTMFTYDNEFEDLDGEVKEMIPKGTLALLHPGLGETVYAQVTFVKDGKFKTYAEKIVPRIVADEKNNMVEVQTFSRPVPYPFHTDSWLVANIYDETDAVSYKASVPVTAPLQQAEEQEDTNAPKTEEEIAAIRTKAPLIEYGKSIGMTDEQVNDSMNLTELKEAVLNYQEEHYQEDGNNA